ncbi:hypothetical protein JXB27_00015 [Candidatus Woesearchaeota archaeon]|nr:hypothetical protein [Candidatus Woesearchaeota archaeon]
MDKPEKVFKAGVIQASVFRNERKVNGVDTYIPSVSFQKRYQEEGQWKTTGVLDTRDLPKAVLVLSKAFDYLVSKGDEEEEPQ